MYDSVYIRVCFSKHTYPLTIKGLSVFSLYPLCIFVCFSYKPYRKNKYIYKDRKSALIIHGNIDKNSRKTLTIKGYVYL